MVYSKEEFLQILKNNLTMKTQVLISFQKTIDKSITSLSHKQITQNQFFLVNNEFESVGIQFIATWFVEDNYKIVLPLIYVYPGFRKKGLATNIIKWLQGEVSNIGGFIQLSIKLPDTDNLTRFYKNLNFKSELDYGIQRANPAFLDFFWSNRVIKVTLSSSGNYLISPQ